MKHYLRLFFSACCLGAAFLIAGASQDWRSELGQEMTIQVRPAPGRDLEAEVKRAAAIAGASELRSRVES